jgi:hypothetical protein
MYFKDSLVKSLNADSPDVPMVGDVSFFIGAEQPYKTVVDGHGYVVFVTEASCVQGSR